MNIRFRRGVAAAAFTISASFLGGAQAQETEVLADMEPVELTFSIFLNESSSLGKTYAEYARMLEENSNGKIKIQFFWGGSLFSLPESLQGVSAGIADMSTVSGAYQAAELPLTALLEHAYNARDMWVGQRATSQLRMQSEALKKEYARNNIHWVAPYTSGTFQIGLGRGVEYSSLEDLNGMSLRTTGGLRAHWIQGLGAEPIFMSVTEIYEATDRGVVSGFENTLSLADTLRQNEVVGTLLKVDSGVVTSTSTVVNLDTWNSLPEEAQKIIVDTGIEWGEMVQARSVIEVERAIVDKWEDQGIVIAHPTEEMEKMARKVALDVVASGAKKLDEANGNTDAQDLIAQFQVLVKEAEEELKENGYPWQ